MKWLISKILAGVFLLAVLAIGMVLLLVDTSPAIEGVDNSLQEDMVLARSVVQLNNRTVEQDDGITQLQFTTEELQAAAAWLLRDVPGTRISFTSEGDSVKLAFTYGFDLVGREFYLNSEATIIPDRQEPEITGMQFGSLSLNGDLGNTLAGLIYEKARDRVPELAQIEEAVITLTCRVIRCISACAGMRLLNRRFTNGVVSTICSRVCGKECLSRQDGWTRYWTVCRTDAHFRLQN